MLTPHRLFGGVSGRSAANGRENGAIVSVVQEPPLASTFHIKEWIFLMAISKALDPLVAYRFWALET